MDAIGVSLALTAALPLKVELDRVLRDPLVNTGVLAMMGTIPLRRLLLLGTLVSLFSLPLHWNVEQEASVLPPGECDLKSIFMNREPKMDRFLLGFPRSLKELGVACSPQLLLVMDMLDAKDTILPPLIGVG